MCRTDDHTTMKPVFRNNGGNYRTSHSVCTQTCIASPALCLSNAGCSRLAKNMQMAQHGYFGPRNLKPTPNNIRFFVICWHVDKTRSSRTSLERNTQNQFLWLRARRFRIASRDIGLILPSRLKLSELILKMLRFFGELRLLGTRRKKNFTTKIRY